MFFEYACQILWIRFVFPLDRGDKLRSIKKVSLIAPFYKTFLKNNLHTFVQQAKVLDVIINFHYILILASET